MNEAQKRQMIRSYFAKSYVHFALGFIVLGIVIMTLGALEVGGVVAASGFVLLFVFSGGGATDGQIDMWWNEDISRLEREALLRIGLERCDLENDPVVVCGPIFWRRDGIPQDEICWKTGGDGIARFSVKSVMIIFLTEHYLNFYSCDFNFIRNVALGERDSQYHYKNVVSVSVGERSQSFTLKEGEKLISGKNFSLSFTDGDKVGVLVSAKELKEMTKADLPTSAVEKAAWTIKAMLKSKM